MKVLIRFVAMKRLYLTGAISLVLSTLNTISIAQNFDEHPSYDRLQSDEPHVIIHQDEQLVQLIAQYSDYHEKHPEIPGYRIEIYSSSGANSKLKARSNRMQFIQQYDSIPAYVVWEYPNFEVRVGDFRTKLEAERALQDIIPSFPFAFITKDDIALPPLVATED
jgi:hypothetical protein